MSVDELLHRNRAWSERVRARDPGFFPRLAAQQKPRYLWIGCSDSRVAANQILDLDPGEVFTHRNIANIVARGDLNCLSVLQFAVDVLKVEHIMVVGHYGCGGVRAALGGDRLGLVDTWVRHVHEVRLRHDDELDALPSAQREDRLCELNVAEQFLHVCESHAVLDAWSKGQLLSVHGWVYSLRDGLLKELGLNATSRTESRTAFSSFIQ